MYSFTLSSVTTIHSGEHDDWLLHPVGTQRPFDLCNNSREKKCVKGRGYKE
jgi:hypothetical protein